MTASDWLMSPAVSMVDALFSPFLSAGQARLTFQQDQFTGHRKWSD
jgi:hypothetical protein